MDGPAASRNNSPSRVDGAAASGYHNHDDPTTADLAPGEPVVDPGPAGDQAADAMAAFLNGRIPEQAARGRD